MLVLERTDSHTVRCLAKPAKKFKKGVKIFFPDGTSATVIEDGSPKTLEFARPIDEMLKAHGSMPLPPYIKREPDKQDFDAYQTVYARNEGAVAAPTAGLHFTADVLKAISKKNAKTAFVTLHVGWGTFRPVRCDDIAGHRMHKERFSVPQETMDAVMDARRKGGRILAVGTTTCRVLETIARRGHPAAEDNCLVAGCPRDCEGETDLFIYPPYQFRLTDMLLTNFHLPRTTLLMLVSAFCGYDLMMKAYKEAIEKRYRLFSYGDAMLIV
jgi:S-adenosylmethionine:tRNA ribosyltransferase-isomerase